MRRSTWHAPGEAAGAIIAVAPGTYTETGDIGLAMALLADIEETNTVEVRIPQRRHKDAKPATIDSLVIEDGTLAVKGRTGY